MFDIEIMATGCPSKGKSETIRINPLGFSEKVEIVLNFVCECECRKDGIPNSPECSDGHGTLECGVCRFERLSISYANADNMTIILIQCYLLYQV